MDNKYKSFEKQAIEALECAKKFSNELLSEYTVKTVPIAGVHCYIQGVLLLGFKKLYEITGDRKYVDFVKEWVDYHLTDEGAIIDPDATVPWFHFGTLDFRQPGILMLDIYKETPEEKYLTALKFLVETMDTAHYPRNSKGSFWHNTRARNEVWLDGLYMISPFIAKYAAQFGKPEYFDTVALQITNIYENMRDENGLLRHGWCEDRSAEWAVCENGVSSTVWARAFGWVVVAIADILDYLPKDHPKYDYIIEIQNNLLEAVCRYQDGDGLWHQVLDKPERTENPQESSGTALYIYAMAKGMRCGYLKKDYMDVIEKGLDGIFKKVITTDENGKTVMTKICAGFCIVTGEYEHYIKNAEYVDNDSHGTGVFIQMCAEVYKLYLYLKDKN